MTNPFFFRWDPACYARDTSHKQTKNGHVSMFELASVYIIKYYATNICNYKIRIISNKIIPYEIKMLYLSSNYNYMRKFYQDSLSNIDLSWKH